MNRVASAITIVRGMGESLEVLLVERSPELRFFGGYLAMPGGVRGPEDGPDDEDGTDMSALLQCAARELFEETGLLTDAGQAARNADQVRAHRKVLVEDRSRERSASIPVWQDLAGSGTPPFGLRAYCRINTPPFAPVRYDTVFFLAELPAGQTPEIWPGELTGGDFWRPADALAAWRRGEIPIVPPVVVLLQLMVQTGGNIDAFAAAAAEIAEGYAAGKLHRVQFTPGVLLAPLTAPTLPPATTTNCLLIGKDPLYIIDPATHDADEQARLFTLLDELISEGFVPAAVLVTHHHPDHIGAVRATSDRYGIPVRGHQITLDRLDPEIAFGDALNDNDTIPLGTAPDGSEDWNLRALFTPGHDKGHLCFLESRYGGLAAGDMVSTISTIMIDPPEGHLATYLESLRRLSQEPIGTLYPAHGPATRNGVKHIELYIRHRGQREAKLKEAIEAGGSTVAELLPLVYWDVDKRMYPFAERSLIAGLAKLVDEGFVRADGERWLRS